MNIALSTNGNTLASPVAEEFEKSTHLLIVNMDDLSFKVFENNPQKTGSDLEQARIIIEHDCEAVITGTIERAAFEALVEEQITRYSGAGLPAQDALVMMEKRRLDIIRDFKGSLGMFHEHHHGGSCNCGED